jgi:hypothetical protein
VYSELSAISLKKPLAIFELVLEDVHQGNKINDFPF